MSGLRECYGLRTRPPHGTLQCCSAALWTKSEPTQSLYKALRTWPRCSRLYSLLTFQQRGKGPKRFYPQESSTSSPAGVPQIAAERPQIVSLFFSSLSLSLFRFRFLFFFSSSHSHIRSLIHCICLLSTHPTRPTPMQTHSQDTYHPTHAQPHRLVCSTEDSGE